MDRIKARGAPKRRSSQNLSDQARAAELRYTLISKSIHGRLRQSCRSGAATTQPAGRSNPPFTPRRTRPTSGPTAASATSAATIARMLTGRNATTKKPLELPHEDAKYVTRPPSAGGPGTASRRYRRPSRGANSAGRLIELSPGSPYRVGNRQRTRATIGHPRTDLSPVARTGPIEVPRHARA
ncbi:uncharacterized protein A4U43_C05F32260 [Asparagus officinalis]|uniref:Uncharacterized protein n=1 Tax=Asparagus officinalis TaxID=4686 RepID=A0A5P1EW32_ASPOF|nr:uncharacterized protein A4U43_C05F32260 [Asparagus officinalis]